MGRIAGTDEEERERREMGWERRERGKRGGEREESREGVGPLVA